MKNLKEYCKIWHSLEKEKEEVKLQKYTEQIIQKTKEKIIEEIEKLIIESIDNYKHLTSCEKAYKHDLKNNIKAKLEKLKEAEE